MAQLTARLLVWEAWMLRRLVMRDGHRRRLLVARAFTHSAGGPAYALIPPALVLMYERTVVPLLLAALGALVVERVMYFALKRRLRRIRPFERFASIPAHVHPPDQFSFPSGHTSAAALVAVVLTAQMPLLQPLLAAWVVGVGASRVCLGVHYPSDVLAGGAMGAVLGWLALALAGLPLPL